MGRLIERWHVIHFSSPKCLAAKVYREKDGSFTVELSPYDVYPGLKTYDDVLRLLGSLDFAQRKWSDPKWAKERGETPSEVGLALERARKAGKEGVA